MLSDSSFPRLRTSWVITIYRHARYYTGVRPQIILLIFNCFFTCSDQQLRPVTEKVQRSNADPAGAAETHLLLEILADMEDVGQHCLWLPLASQLKLTIVGNIHLLAELLLYDIRARVESRVPQSFHQHFLEDPLQAPLGELFCLICWQWRSPKKTNTWLLKPPTNLTPKWISA